MSKMFVPKSIKRMRFESVKKADPETEMTKSLEYLVSVMKKIVVSEKHILDANLFVIDVRPEAEKLLIKRALEGLSPNNKVKKLTSSVRKSTARTFRGSVGSTSTYKRMYIRFDTAFDSSLLIGGEN